MTGGQVPILKGGHGWPRAALDGTKGQRSNGERDRRRDILEQFLASAICIPQIRSDFSFSSPKIHLFI